MSDDQDKIIVEAPVEVTEEPMPKPPKRKRRWLRYVFSIFLLFIIFAISFSFWLVQTNSGLHFALFRMPAWFGVTIEAKDLEGTIWDGFTGNSWKINTEGADVTLTTFKLEWQAKRLWGRQLWIDQIDLGHLHLTLKDTPAKKSEPLTLPKSVALPIDVYLGELSLGGFTMGKSKDALFLGNSIRYTYQNDAHQLNINHLRLPWGQGVGSITLKENTPFPLVGDIRLNGVLDGVKAEGSIKLSGSLKEPAVKGVLSGNGLAVDLVAELNPFAEQLFEKVTRLELAAGNINPKAFWEGAPQGNISASLIARPKDSQTLHGQLIYANTSAASFTKGGIPIALIQGDLDLTENGLLSINEVFMAGLHEGSGTLTGKVDLTKQTMDVAFLIKNAQLREALSSPISVLLNGDLKAAGTFTEPVVTWDLNTEALLSHGKLQVAREKEGRVLHISDTYLSARRGGRLTFSGSFNLFGSQALKLVGQTQNFNPNIVSPELPVGNITAKINLDGELEPNLKLNTQLNISPSTLSGAAFNGTADIQLLKDRLTRANVNINLGANRILTSGSFGGERDLLKLNINAPNLAQFGFGLSGSLIVNGTVLGRTSSMTMNMDGSAQRLQFGKMLQLQDLRFTARASPNLSAPLNINIEGKELVLGSNQINQLSFQAIGTGTSHRLNAKAGLKLDSKDYQFTLAAQGGLNAAHAWQGQIQTLDLKGATNLLLQQPVRVDVGSEHLNLGSAKWGAFGGSLNLERLAWRQGQSLTTKGSINNIQIAQIMNLLPKIPIDSSLVIRGEWDLAYSNNASGFIKLYRQAGDIALPVSKTRKTNLGISEFELGAKLKGARINLNLDAKTQFGEGAAKLSIAQSVGSSLMAVPLDGSLTLSVPDLQTFRLFLPVSTQVRGRINANLKIGGTGNNPSVTGTINGDELWFRERNSGLRLGDGTLRAKFEGRKLVLEELTFLSTSTRRVAGADGETVRRGKVRAQGVIQMVGNTPDVNIDVILDRFSVFDKPNRRLVLSGKNNILYNIRDGATLVGNLKVDYGRFDMPSAGTPTLDDDVVVIGREQEDVGDRTPINLDITVDLGERFKFSGQGLNVMLRGNMRVQSRAGQTVQANGQINLVDGRFRAYGQDLDIERGVIAFVGPIDNPVLNLRAVRHLSPVGAGVEVTGTLAVPRIVLVANEPMSQKDKLAWLVLGRASSGDNDDSALAASAGAWLAGSINDRVGFLDDIGIITRQRTSSNGEVSPAEQFLTVGRQVTNDIYVSYEYGLNTADQAVKIAYQLSKAWQLILRAGQDSTSVGTRYTVRFD